MDPDRCMAQTDFFRLDFPVIFTGFSQDLQMVGTRLGPGEVQGLGKFADFEFPNQFAGCLSCNYNIKLPH